MRGFGDTEPLPIDATRGLRDWADDTTASLLARSVSRAAAPRRLVDRRRRDRAFALTGPVASLTFVDPVAVRLRRLHARRHPHFPDFAGSGGGR